jgi:HSP20 family protein
MLYPTLWRTNGSTLLDDALSLHGQFDRMLGRSFGAPRFEFPALGWAPAVDVRETRDEFEIVAELPGVEPADVNVTFQNGVLTLTGEKRQYIQEGKEANTQYLERSYGRFERSFTLPQGVDPNAIKARSVNGVLTITLPKAEAAKPRRIEIEAGQGGKHQLGEGQSPADMR